MEEKRESTKLNTPDFASIVIPELNGQTPEKKRRILLRVAYDGTNYHGWQAQNDVCVEGTLREAVEELTGEKITLIGGSRTDAGVHAKCNPVVFDTESSIPGDRFFLALNTKLPRDIRVTESREVAPDFHPRHCVSRKTYEYRVLVEKTPDPLRRLYTHSINQRLDVASMQQAAVYLLGEHDFKSFCNPATQAETTIRELYELSIEENNGEILFRVTGSGFLYNMVRILVGTLLEVGYGRIRPEEMSEILEKKDRRVAGPTAPGKGLMLVAYEFAENP